MRGAVAACAASIGAGALFVQRKAAQEFLHRNAPQVVRTYGRVRRAVHATLPAANGKFGADLVAPNIYLGSIGDAHCVADLKARGVTRVLTAAAGVKPSYPEDFEYLTLDVMDVGDEPLDVHFEAADEFLSNAQAPVLVHCMYGMSRSATLVCAHLIRSHGYTVDDAIRQLQEARPRVRPNAGFVEQLRDFEGRMNSAE